MPDLSHQEGSLWLQGQECRDSISSTALPEKTGKATFLTATAFGVLPLDLYSAQGRLLYSENPHIHLTVYHH